MVSRGGKTRLLGFVCMVLVLSAVLYVFHGTQVELDNVRHSAYSCSHLLESLSSQLQVVVEHKLKLETLLKDEKLEHMKSKEELNELIRVEKELRDKQNVDAMNRYSEIERNHEVLQEEEKKVREELEALKLKYLEKKKNNAQLALDLDASLSQLQSLKNEKVKPDSGKENIDNDHNNNLQNSNELSEIKFNEKLIDNINASKLSSVTPAINPQAIAEATAKSSTPMIDSKLYSANESLHNENDEANPIKQPSVEIPSPVEGFNNDVVSQNENETSPSQESQVNGNESMKAMPAPPQEETVKKEKLIKKEEENVNQKSKNSYKYDYDQDQNHLKEDEDDEDINDFDVREENQHMQ